MSPLMPEKHSRYPIRIASDFKLFGYRAAPGGKNFSGQNRIH